MSDFKKVNEIIKRNIEDEDEHIRGNKRKKEYIDDGRSIADLNIEGFSWYVPKRYSQERKNLNELKITRKERVAMIIGALQAILPIAITILILYFGVFVFISAWLN